MFRFAIPLRIVWSWAVFLAVQSAPGDDAPYVCKIPPYPDVVFINAKIGGFGHQCCIDSGFSLNAFNLNLRGLLGTRGRETHIRNGYDQRVPAELFGSPILHIGSIKLSDKEPSLCFDMCTIRELSGRNHDCILGMPLFLESIVQFDFDRQRFSILPLTTEPKPEWGKQLSVHVEEKGRRTISVDFGDQVQEECLVDTGQVHSFSLSQQSYMRLIAKRAIVQIEDTDVGTIAGPHAVREARLSKVKVGDYENRDLLVIGDGDVSSVGIKYFRRFIVTFDFANNRMYLAKGTAFDAPDKQSAAGLAMKRINGRTRVEIVYEGGAAEKAGIAVNDQLLAVAGEPIEQKPIAEIGWMFREKADANGRVILTYLRNNEEQRAELTIRR